MTNDRYPKVSIVPASNENEIIRRLPRSEAEIILPRLSAIDLPKGYALARQGETIEYIYFLEDGICSIQSVSTSGERTGVALVGFDGVVPLSSALHITESFHDAIILIAGHGVRLSVRGLQDVAAECPVFVDLLHRFSQNLATQMSYTILTKAADHIPARFARWLLMIHDRLRGEAIPLTHEEIGQALSIRRPTITTTLHLLEGERFIQSDRGQIVILDRERLENFASSTYGTPEAEYVALFPKPLD
ncbi:Crp/Fnr family transcriptional regulator [Rhizobium sp. P38BS-XIX]|uniref:Crp/Fnr family transcriptional regulator n=1 Tax=Rhizobium sp. P38BS-XIX TaxID=2726740 RepID=UPI001456FA50|nr:Crp/Fnr family transcriptional regulator [Rhizobium sp. P38BS-XIX]NLR97275.1 Crp/Fnr family transcriptional regulator [Rhizobium sp. P38BS-XIX]